MQNDDIVTYMNSTVVVPPAPLKNGGSPAFWPGIGAHALLFVSLAPNSPLTEQLEDSGESSVIQPILKWINNHWYIFNEYVTPQGRDFQTFHHRVDPGDTIFMEITYFNSNASYVMVRTLLSPLLREGCDSIESGSPFVGYRVPELLELRPRGRISLHRRLL